MVDDQRFETAMRKMGWRPLWRRRIGPAWSHIRWSTILTIDQSRRSTQSHQSLKYFLHGIRISKLLLYFPDKTLLSFTNDLQEKLLSGLNTGLIIKNENELFDVLKQNLVHFQKFGTVNDYSTKKDISFLSRDRQSLILKNKILSLI